MCPDSGALYLYGAAAVRLRQTNKNVYIAFRPREARFIIVSSLWRPGLLYTMLVAKGEPSFFLSLLCHIQQKFTTPVLDVHNVYVLVQQTF